ncbi:MAG: acetyl-CoA carboxylase biotin carboxyl carrier protein [Flavobacteriales bacterium]|jgi:acetyl-CoA carboxylase biotin carboxyl carrier protein|nr:acetyl-CoA carboxylase biotin carboxyl carrier protein [Flavobacteriales bacterium]
MNLKDIQELIKFVAKSGATDVNLEIDNIKISIKSPPKKRRGEDEELKTVIHEAPAQLIATQPPVVQAPPVAKESTEKESNYITVKASMIGTFYRSSSPESSPFVNVGDTIKAGDTICIIEAMKLFNEIESEISGKIIKVLVDDTTPIEFDQPLFLVDPS